MQDLTRRTMLGAFAAGAALPFANVATAAKRMIPEKVRARVIVDNDFAGDPDGLVALAHQLLSPRTQVTLITSSFLSAEFSLPGVNTGKTAAQGRDIAVDLVKQLKLPAAPRIIAGPETAMSAARAPGEAARAIVAEAMREDPLPLWFTCGGPLTNLAEALLIEPRIADRMKVVWIGGGGYPDGGWEYNLSMDAEAARAVVERSNVPLWQVPQPTYRQMQISVAEMATDMRPISPFSRWLYDRFTSPPDFVDLGGGWPMGDSPLVLMTALNPQSSVLREMPARRITDKFGYGAVIPGRTITVMEEVDARFIHADFLARLKLHRARG